jgi:hypothetical protein
MSTAWSIVAWHSIPAQRRAGPSWRVRPAFRPLVVGPLTASMGLMVETPHKVRPYPTAPDPLVDVF